MSSECDSETSGSEKANGNPVGNFARTLEHFKSGYANAQEVIRFIDTKTSFLTGATTLIIGFVLEAAKQYSQLPPAVKHNFAIHPYLIFALMNLGEFSLLAGGLCVWCSVLSLIARPPAKKMRRNSSMLFPFFEGKISEKQYCSKTTQDMTEEEILKEYEAQIWNVGLILRKKVMRHRWAGVMFLVQLITLTAGGFIILFCIQN